MKRAISDVSGVSGELNRDIRMSVQSIEQNLAQTRIELANLLECVGCKLGYPAQRDHACLDPDRESQVEEFNDRIHFYEGQLRTLTSYCGACDEEQANQTAHKQTCGSLNVVAEVLEDVLHDVEVKVAHEEIVEPVAEVHEALVEPVAEVHEALVEPVAEVHEEIVEPVAVHEEIVPSVDPPVAEVHEEIVEHIDPPVVEIVDENNVPLFQLVNNGELSAE
jgi:hypothetical protein